MVVGIIGAMEEELEPLSCSMDSESIKVKANMRFKCGYISGLKVVLVVSGIGKVNAAVCTQILADDFSVDKIINVGVAGGMGSNVKCGDVVIAESLVQHDVDTSAFGDKIGQIPRMDTFDFVCDKELVKKAQAASLSVCNYSTHTGRIVTGDQFIADCSKLKWLQREFGAIACEMEGGSIAQACYLNHIPFVVIRSISDNANSDAHMDYDKFKTIAIKNSSEILKIMLGQLTFDS